MMHVAHIYTWLIQVHALEAKVKNKMVANQLNQPYIAIHWDHQIQSSPQVTLKY